MCSVQGAGRQGATQSRLRSARARVVLLQSSKFYKSFVASKPNFCPHDLIEQQVAEVLSEALGRKIRHEEYSEEKLVAHLAERRVPEAYAKMLGNLDTQIADGAENIMNKVVEEVGGRLPTTLRAFVEKNKTVWMKS